MGQIDLLGDETVLDVGCGNGQYLQALIEQGHTGRLLGVDISAGMLSAVPARVDRVGADVQALPVVDSVFDLTLAMHMLYHVADKPLACRELRRVTKPHGQLLVALPDRSSLSELHQLIDDCAGHLDLAVARHDPGVGFDEATTILEGLFESVRRVDVPGELVVTDAGAVVEYAASLSRVVRVPARQRDPLLGLVQDRVAATITLDGSFRLNAAGGCLVCQ